MDRADLSVKYCLLFVLLDCILTWSLHVDGGLEGLQTTYYKARKANTGA